MRLLLTLLFAFSLPLHTRVDPVQQRVPLQIGPEETLAATATLTDPSGSSRIVVWNTARVAHLLAPPVGLDPGELSAGLELGGFDGAGTIYATLVKSMELEAGGNETVPGLYPHNAFAPLYLKPCDAVTSPDFLPHIEHVAADAIYLTYESPDSTEVLDGDQTSDLAPYAVRLQGGACTLLGRASIRDVNGAFAVGFRGYLGQYIAPTDLDPDRQRYVAVRIHAGSLTELGPGVAMAVAQDGTTVGADAPPIHESETESANGSTETFSCCTPHAMLWHPDGTSVALAPAARSSIAYAIENAGHAHIAGGMLVDANGIHRAFLWIDGNLYLLDDVVHAAGWRFESVFAFGPHHQVFGVGTHNGTAAVFEVSAVTGS
jgi:hypothetical protein